MVTSHFKLSKEEVEVLKSIREFLEEGERGKWSDTPPLLDSTSILARIILENALPNGRNAKVGDTYLERAYNIRIVSTLKPKATETELDSSERTTRDTETEVSEEVETIIEQGFKVWVVIQPKWTAEDQERINQIHEKYAAIYGHKEQYKCLYEQRSVQRWPKDKFPNGQYWTERWVPKVWNDTTQEWLPASEKDCQNWDKIPEEKKRVDFLFGVLPVE